MWRQTSAREAHSTNMRHAASEIVTDEWWFGFEQEYFLTNPDGSILGWEEYLGKPQGEYYCVGAANVKGGGSFRGSFRSMFGSWY